jgi:anoctamin-10
MGIGYLSLFSVVWPLTAVSFLINNWIELRSDALKIALETQRPVPWRADSIGPWLDALGFLTWLGSLSTSALVFLFSGEGLGSTGEPWNVKPWALLLTMFFSEHIYLAVRMGVRKALSKIDSPGLQKERRERFAVRRQYLQEALGEGLANRVASGGIASGEKISRSTLEEEARQSTLRGHGTPEERFWQRQQGQQETISVGSRYIRVSSHAHSTWSFANGIIGGSTIGEQEEPVVSTLPQKALPTNEDWCRRMEMVFLYLGVERKDGRVNMK